MQLQLRRSRLLVPALLVVLVGGAAGYLARSESSTAASATKAEADETAPAVVALPTDGRYAPFESGDLLLFEPEIRQPVAAPVPQFEAVAWSQFSNLNVQAVAVAEAPREPATALPAPAGFEESLTDLERSRLVAARSIENDSAQRDRGPGVRVAVGACVPVPGINQQ